jgi:hypothetical protein
MSYECVFLVKENFRSIIKINPLYPSYPRPKKIIRGNLCEIREIRGTIPPLRENPSNLRVSASPSPS